MPGACAGITMLAGTGTGVSAGEVALELVETGVGVGSEVGVAVGED